MNANDVQDRYDVVIAGARVAGASTALLLARAGLRVLVVDPVPRGRDTLSTHALMRAGVLQLARWGVLPAIRSVGTPAIVRTIFDYGDETITVPIQPRDGVDALYAPRRTVLDPILADTAAAAGAHVVHGLALVDILETDGRVTGALVAGPDRVPQRVHADLVIGADGIRSRVARLIGAPTEFEGTASTASIYGYWTGVGGDAYRWSYRPGVGVGVIPSNDAACIFASFPADRFAAEHGNGLDALFRDGIEAVDSDLAAQLGLSSPVGGLRAFPGTPGFLRRSHGPGWALVGDAGYFRDPFTAHGITDALRDAELLARAVLRGQHALADYQAARDDVARGILDVTERIASFDWTMDEVKDLHRMLSRAMKAGLDVVEGFDRGVAGAAAPARLAVA